MGGLGPQPLSYTSRELSSEDLFDGYKDHAPSPEHEGKGDSVALETHQ